MHDARARALAFLRTLAKRNPRDLGRYVAAGAVAYVVDVTTFLVARSGFAATLVAANLIARAAGAFTAFELNHRWTFAAGREQRRRGQSLLRYLMLWLASMMVSTGLLAFIVTWLRLPPGLPELFAKAAVEAFILFGNFLVSRAWVFRVRS